VTGQFIKIVQTAVSLDEGPIRSQTEAADSPLLTASEVGEPEPHFLTVEVSNSPSTSILISTAIVTAVETSVRTAWIISAISTVVSSSDTSSSQSAHATTSPVRSSITPDDSSNGHINWALICAFIPLVIVASIGVFYTLRHFRKKHIPPTTSNFEVLSDPIVPMAYEMEATPSPSSRNAIYEMCAVVSNVRYEHRRTISELEDSCQPRYKNKRKFSNELRIAVHHGQYEVDGTSLPVELASERSPRLRSIYELPP